MCFAFVGLFQISCFIGNRNVLVRYDCPLSNSSGKQGFSTRSFRQRPPGMPWKNVARTGVLTWTKTPVLVDFKFRIAKLSCLLCSLTIAVFLVIGDV